MNLKKRILLLVVALIFIASLCVNSKQPPLPVPTEVEGWARNVSRNVRDYISETAQAHIMPKNFCEEKGLLLVFIHSKFDKFDARRAIRETWGQKRDNVTFYFLLGEDKNSHHEVQLKLRDESQRFNDIVQERFVDSYNNLTLKSITMLKLFHLHCSDSYKYLLKIDDDVYLNIASALKELTNRSITTNVLLGHIYNVTNAIRNPASKWFVPYELYPDEKYPPYLCGAAYIMSADVAVKLYRVALETPIFYIEDVYITGMCAKKANVTLENSGGFNCYYAKKYVCLYKQYFVYHYFEPRDIKKAHELVAGKKCPLTGSWQAILEEERALYNDIIQERFIDSYNNLTLKSTFMLKVVNRYCKNSFKYLMKADDDVFVNLPRVLHMLSNRKTHENVILGRLRRGWPIRDTYSKWYVPYEWYPEQEYPANVCGASYIMSFDVARKLYDCALSTPLVHMEDIFLTGICGEKMNVLRENNYMFTCNNRHFHFCYYKNYFTLHYYSAIDMVNAWEMLHNHFCDYYLKFDVRKPWAFLFNFLF
ncbi:Beta-1,3-galactosyltransferase brn-like Protein [Tribolium castaneum]|uniref:Beta-1,3-galactosyltransferase brn-like Protein n=1 Tax=Tribolium castaneum TaxID=7070 RepID=A0A139WF69_TRICA|nr:Beta-1,3-galactosyltransferase brn-like Protein [Tribolium castaneum]